MQEPLFLEFANLFTAKFCNPILINPQTEHPRPHQDAEPVGHGQHPQHFFGLQGPRTAFGLLTGLP